MDSAAMLNTFHNICQAQKDEDGLLSDLLSIFERMKALNISRGTSNNGYSQDQDGLLDGAVSILEQMKILNGSRGTNMEALAQAHVAKINELDENHAAGMQSKLWYTKNLEDRILEQDEEILQLKARESSTANGAQNRALCVSFEDEIVKIKTEFDEMSMTQQHMFDELELVRPSREKIVRRTMKYASKTNRLFNQLHNYGLHFYAPRDLGLASTGFASFINESGCLQEDMKYKIDRKRGWKKDMDARSEKKWERNKSVCYGRVKKLVDLVTEAGFEVQLRMMKLLFDNEFPDEEEDNWSLQSSLGRQ